MKKLLSVLLAIVMVVGMLPMAVFAAGVPAISFETDFTNDLVIGDTFTVTASLTDTVPFGAMTLSLKWNEAAVSFTGFEATARGALVSDVFPGGDYAKPVINPEEGIISAVDPYGYDLEGALFTANFEIVGNGELGIGLKTDSAAEFQIRNVEGTEDIPVTLDFSAISGLTVGGVAAGPEMPEDAPFTAITTDAGPVLDVEYVEDLEFNYGYVPYYVVTIPADAETAYVTAPDQVVMEDWTTGAMQATAYAAALDELSTPLYISYNYEEVSDGIMVEVPLYMTSSDWSGNEIVMCFVADEYNDATHAFGIEDSNYACLGLISFVYGDGAPSYNISVDDSIVGGSIAALNEDYEEITSAKEGDLVYLEVTPDEGYKAMTYGYILDGETYHCENGCFTMPAGDIALTATFKGEEAEKTGYTATMLREDFVTDLMESGVNGDLQIPVKFGHMDENVTAYNCYDVVLEYDPDMLTLVSMSQPGLQVDGNTIRVSVYGEDKTFNSQLLLVFEPKDAGETSVRLISAKVGISEDALNQDAAEAIILDAETVITLNYHVALPGKFLTGESTVVPGKDYTFSIKDHNFDYDLTAKVTDVDGNETPVDIIDNGDGTYTVKAEQITGNLTVSANQSAKKYNITLGEDMEHVSGTVDVDGVTMVQYKKNYTAKLNKQDGYGYKITVTIGGETYTGFTYDEETCELSIQGRDITGDIVIDSGKIGAEYTVTFAGTGAGDAEGEAGTSHGAAYSFKLNKEDGYVYSVTATMGGEPVELAEEDGTYTIEEVTGNIVITVEKEADMTVEVTEYVTLNGRTVFLVTASQTLAEGEVMYYGDADDAAMFWSEQYGAWAYLVITDGTLSVEDAREQITVAAGTVDVLVQTYDVNGSGKADINDAQLVYDMYNNEYQDFAFATMEKFLNADVNGSKTIDVNDAAAIVAEIQK